MRSSSRRKLTTARCFLQTLRKATSRVRRYSKMKASRWSTGSAGRAANGRAESITTSGNARYEAAAPDRRPTPPRARKEEREGWNGGRRRRQVLLGRTVRRDVGRRTAILGKLPPTKVGGSLPVAGRRNQTPRREDEDSRQARP